MRPSLSLALLVIASALGCTSGAGSEPVVEMRPPVASGEAPREAPSKGPRTFAVGGFGFVETLGDRRVLLLSTDVDVAWGDGKTELLTKPEDSLRIARVTIAPGQLPESHRVAGLAVDLYDGDSLVGETKLGATWIASMSFDYNEPRPQGEERPSNQALADDAWNNGTRWLVADLGPAEPKNATWGRLAVLPKPGLPTVTPAEPQIADRALALLRREAAYTEAQDSFDAHYASIQQPKPATGWEETARTTVTAFTHAGKRYVLARLEAGEACSFAAIIARLYRVEGGELVPVNELATQDEPRLLIDSNGDGVLEAVTSSTFGAGWLQLQNLVGNDNDIILREDRPEHFCPC
jgi:hypothetical protein